MAEENSPQTIKVVTNVSKGPSGRLYIDSASLVFENGKLKEVKPSPPESLDVRGVAGS